jgi:sulfonate transport system ATP-binding protein
MAQRASLARALARNPGVLVLDEPFGALDALTRLKMHDLLLEVHAAEPTTVLLVTHDVDEALTLADRVLVLDEGRVAREWRVEVRRSARTPQHPEIAEVREQVLASLGVHHETTTHHALETGAA